MYRYTVVGFMVLCLKFFPRTYLLNITIFPNLQHVYIHGTMYADELVPICVSIYCRLRHYYETPSEFTAHDGTDHRLQVCFNNSQQVTSTILPIYSYCIYILVGIVLANRVFYIKEA